MLKDFFTSEYERFISGEEVRWASQEALNVMKNSEEAVQDLMDLDNPSIFNYIFSYTKKSDGYQEYDGMIINAPNEDLAWEIFLGTDCEFGLPNERDYSCKLSQ